MFDVCGVLACLNYSIRKLMSNARFYIAVLLTLFVTWDMIAPVKSWLASTSYMIAPWLFPYVTSDLFGQMTIMGGLLFILCDAPFLDDMQPLIIIRIGRVSWCIGQLLYIICASLLYTCIIAIGCVAMMLPCVEWTIEWGKIIASLSCGKINIATYFQFDRLIYESMSAVKATVLSIGYNWSGGVCLGFIMFFFNLSGRRMTGNLIAGAILLQDLFTMMLLPNDTKYFSIISMTRMSTLLYDGKLTQTEFMIYSAVVLSSVALIFALLSLWRTRRMSVSVMPAI